MKTDIVIIGGGISGLHTAYQLEKKGVDFILLEGRERLGGRILSNNYNSSANGETEISPLEFGEYDENLPAFDLGPSWFWLGQSNMEALINELNLHASVFPQQANGQSIYEDQQGQIQKGFYGISMDGAYRLNGGMRQMVAKLESQIDPNKIILSANVNQLEFKSNRISTTYCDVSGDYDYLLKPQTIESKKIVMAIPPRIAISSIKFQPTLPDNRMNELNSYPTWMAGHAKLLAVYDKPFWLEQGLSGDAVSHLGPLREIHDASSDPNSSNKKRGYALFGFVGIPGSYRLGNRDQICSTAIDQLVRLFGEQAANPSNVTLQDWAQENFTATENDQTMSGGHANSSIRHYTEPNFDHRLIWSGTETADHKKGFNGLLEGALEASLRSVKLLD